LNEKLIQSYGVVSSEAGKIKLYNPNDIPSGLLFDQTKQVLAVRFSTQKGFPHYSLLLLYP
jgi:hypothetical protein